METMIYFLTVFPIGLAYLGFMAWYDNKFVGVEVG